MTRSDVFTTFSRPLLWSVHMLPIYRQLDGVDTKEKNAEVFRECSKVLKSNRSLLIFAEGFTDDVFVRRLKPIRKGAVRIGFSALEYMNWSENVYISAVGCNYSDPNRMRSDLLISTSEGICLNDYREEYHANPGKVVAELTLLAEKMMQDQITHIENPHLTELHETIMILTRKGMNSISYDKKLSLKDRYLYSKKLANWLNNEPMERVEPLKEVAKNYMNSLRELDITDNEIWSIKNNENEIFRKVFQLLFLSPFAILGAFHCGFPYFLIKKFVENKFKRAVFWGSTKLLLCMILIGLINIPVIFVFDDIFNLSNWWGFVYYLLIGLFGQAFYIGYSIFNDLLRFKKIKKVNIENLVEKREQLFELVKKNIPTQFL
jgi:hypothetical protein